MTGMFNGKATEYTEYIFKMEAYFSTLESGGKGSEVLRAAATEAKDMDDDEVTNLAAIYWKVSALNSAVASCLITTTTGEVGTLVRRVLQAFPGYGRVQELNRWYRPRSTVHGAASMAGIIAPSRAKSTGELQRFITDWELRVAERLGKTQRVPSRSQHEDSRDDRTLHRRSNTYSELRTRVAAHVGEKMIQRHCAHGYWRN